ncbi:unnamed protein product [Caenorhabditis angaria]|uniref:Glycosyltransferase family 92 protein n=1 Tax=Caenorhabditis angaria TaxID=860376 RepID=A0A9P1N505_9PELO|nr:unnamed protein product [Caenorhabditis angaria]
MVNFRTFFSLVLFLIFFYLFFRKADEENFEHLPHFEQRDDYKAFITSSYFYEKSESLGDNAFALVMSMTGSKIRKGWMSLEQWNFLNVPILTIRAKNATNSIVVRTKFLRITPHEICEIISIFATFTLIPNITTISMIGDNGITDIPIQIPSMEKHDVVICINPMFLGEQWQNFLFISHLYRKFEGFINLYYISAIESFYYLMKEYEKEGYLTIQPWASVKFRDVPQNIIDPYREIEYTNQASANTDCLLKYKETAKFITFLDLNEIIIPRRLPTFLQEFQSAVWNWKKTVYIYYHKEHVEALTVRDANIYSFSKMFKSMKQTEIFLPGKIILNPKNANYTWLYGPPIIPNGFGTVMNRKTALINMKIKWLHHHKEDVQERQYDSALDNYMSSDDLADIDSEIRRTYYILLSKSNNTRILQHTHTFIHSVYYYKNSKSLGKNAIAIVATMNKRTVPIITDMKIDLIATDSDGNQMKTKATLTSENLLSERCDYLMILAQANTLNNMAKLEIESVGSRTLIPFKYPIRKASKPVIFCVSPQFAAEQWQVFLTQVHIAKKYGAHLHIYVVSMIESYFELLREYEKLGYISIEPWLTIKFAEHNEPVLEPNSNVELRAQTAAHTDCILMYKESASFIGSLDLDDILIPINSRSYYEEFEKEHMNSILISAVNYVKRDYETVKSPFLNEFSITNILKYSKPLNTNDTGKSFARPTRYNSSWAHWSRNADLVLQYLTPDNFQPVYRKIKFKNSGMFHIKTIKFADRPTLYQRKEADLKSIINLVDLEEIEMDLKKHLNLPQIKSISNRLPKDDFYINIIFNCYNQSFYHMRDTDNFNPDFTCVNAYYCELPQRDEYPCIHSDANYKSGPSMIPITYHFAENHGFSRNIGCYQ